MTTGFAVLFISISFLCIGHDFDKGPMPDGCRKRVIRYIYRACCGFGIFTAGMTTKVTYQDVDYSYYLGEGYKSRYKDIKKTSTIVSNHSSWLDCLILIYIVTPAFAPSSFFKTVPVFNKVCSVLDSIYINRGADEVSRANIVKTIVDRQNMIEETGKYAPFCMFVEGATTNGTHLLKFRRGAFIGEKRVTPMYFKYRVNSFSTAYDCIDFLPLCIMNLCWAGLKCDVNIMPDFEPNEYLFKKHAKKGGERWEIFAWAVRDVMAKTGEFEYSYLKLQEKVDYYLYMMKYQNEPDPAKDIEMKLEMMAEMKSYD